MTMKPICLGIITLGFAIAACGGSESSRSAVSKDKLAIDGPKCGLAIDCEPGKAPYDSNSDGCDDACKAERPQCGVAIDCEPGKAPYDSNGDGCEDACKADVACPAILCETGKLPYDSNGDGCEDACKAR